MVYFNPRKLLHPWDCQNTRLRAPNRYAGPSRGLGICWLKIFVIGGPGTSYKLNISDYYGNAGINIHAIDYVRPNQKIEISIT